MALSIGYSAVSCYGSEGAKAFVERSEKALFWFEAISSVALVILGVLGQHSGLIPCSLISANVILICGVTNLAAVFFVAKFVLHMKLNLDNLFLKGGR